VLGSFNYCGSYAIAGPGSFMSNQQQVRVWQCGTTARFAESVEEKSIQTSKPDYLSEAFPNPASDVLNIAYSLPSGTSKARIALYSNSGQLIELLGIQANDTSNSAQFNVSNLPAGLYTASLEVDGMVIGNRRISITH
jgi:hypothetical protein